jgi:hypothetical protein
MSMVVALVSELITYKRACAYLCGRDSNSLMKFWIINCMIWPWFCKEMRPRIELSFYVMASDTILEQNANLVDPMQQLMESAIFI